MERDDDDNGDDDGQNARKRCQARIILEWKRVYRGAEKEEGKEYRRADGPLRPLRAKA